MSHGPATEWKEDKSSKKKARLGIVMVTIYTMVYGSFVAINVTNPKLMKIDIGSLNLAIVYGFGLIVLALVQAAIYNHYCTRLEEKDEADELAKASQEESNECINNGVNTDDDISNVKVLEEITERDYLQGGKIK